MQSNTLILFKQSGNRLYIDLNFYEMLPQLREFIDLTNSAAPGTFTIDKINQRVWFYPPENYVMPGLRNEKPR